MAQRNPRYDVLFEPVPIGPVTAPNRFYQTPHATGMGYAKPKASATLRGIKAEGGWGVVCTEYCSIHPSSEDAPYGFLTLWDEEDVRALAVTTDAIHAHGSLAGIELWHGGMHAINKLMREPALAPSESSSHFVQPQQVRAMDKQDIAQFRQWQINAARRAERAGFDIVYVYAGHGYLPFQFLSPLTNQRSDEYGGSLENRVRLLREMIEDTREAVGDTCAVAVRLAVDEMHGPGGITSDGEGREIVEMLAELPDLWDVNLAGDLGYDSRSSRFSPEGYQEDYVSFVKSVTSKPVVSVGRFTSPDTMVSQIKRGVQDFIGAARPSIADPFLPRKINEGREDEVRECIGCNICRASNNEGVPLRCTQNPTMGEEWRRGWHPEIIVPQSSEAKVLVVGAGPAGLEASLALGRRGYQVMLAEAGRELGGRLVHEAALPGLGNWMRVRDHRVHMLEKLAHVEIFRESALTPDDMFDVAPDHVALATGSSWRRDGAGTLSAPAAEIDPALGALTPNDVFAGAELSGDVTIYDDEHYFMAGALAEKFVLAGHKVTLVTPHTLVSAWTEMTNEQIFIQQKLSGLGVEFIFSHALIKAGPGKLVWRCTYSGQEFETAANQLVLVTGRSPNRALHDALEARGGEWADAGIKSVACIGDCLVPSTIADAVHRGHRYARELEVPASNRMVRRERPIPELEAEVL
ncbi:MAG: NADH:flavin oxidoreductase [Alphaproteobacteria bacterium]|nr:NADH:flavin oxidoreductase [Alphaproteobacteria bacterium]